MRRREATRRRRLQVAGSAGACLALVAVVSGAALTSPQPDQVLNSRGIAHAASVEEGAAATANSVAAAWKPNVKAARKYILGREGWASFSAVTAGFSGAVHGKHDVPLASTVKVILMTAMARSAADRPLTVSESEAMSSMIRLSDNDSADALMGAVGIEGLEESARIGGASGLEPDYAWGLSRASAVDMARFMWRLPSLLPVRHRKVSLQHLESVTDWQRWGIARIPRPSWTLYFKGGWGISDGRMAGTVNHQIALLRRGKKKAALAIMTQGNPTHEYGVETIEGVARALLEGLPGPPPDSST